MLTIGDKLIIEITSLSHDGSGIGRIEGLAVFVPGALPHERVEIQVIEIKRNYARAKLLSVLDPSRERVKPRCPKYGTCGGCQLQHLRYQTQLEHKGKRVQDALTRLGKLQDIPVQPILGMNEPWHYRNKAQFHASQVHGRLCLGYFRQGSHQVVPIDDCLLLPHCFSSLIGMLEELLNRYGIKAYDPKTKTGILKHVVIKKSNATGEIMVILVTNLPELPHSQGLTQAIMTQNPQIVSLVQNINPGNREILGKEFRLLAGQERIKERLGSLEFLISPPAFFQVNSNQATVLYEKAIAYANLSGTEIVFDLYCGTGTLALFLAKKAARVYGIEVISAAIQDAQANARLNSISNAEFIAGSVENILPEFASKSIRPDVIFLDPPRQGCTKELLETVVNLVPRPLVYISCDPGTLARDLGLLNQLGYQALEVQPVDMFPQTMHVEAVVSLSHKKADTRININVEFGDEEGQIPIDEIARKAEEGRYNKKEI